MKGRGHLTSGKSSLDCFRHRFHASSLDCLLRHRSEGSFFQLSLVPNSSSTKEHSDSSSTKEHSRQQLDEIVKEGEQYIERFSALVTVGVAPILVAMITVRVEIGGYTIQFYQNNHSGIFCIQPNGGIQLNFCTPNGLPIHFQWRVANIYNFSLSTANYLIFRR